MKRMKLLRQKELTDRLQEPIDKLKQGAVNLSPLLIPSRNCYRVSHHAIFWDSQAYSVNDSESDKQVIA